jgi:hypothetical protein
LYLSIEISWRHSFTGDCNAANVFKELKFLFLCKVFIFDYFTAIMLTISASTVTPATPTTGATISTTTTKRATKPGKCLFQVFDRPSIYI